MSRTEWLIATELCGHTPSETISPKCGATSFVSESMDREGGSLSRMQVMDCFGRAQVQFLRGRDRL